MSWDQDRARVASLSLSRKTDDRELVAALNNPIAERYIDIVRRLIATVPKLNAAQWAELERFISKIAKLPAASASDRNRQQRHPMSLERLWAAADAYNSSEWHGLEAVQAILECSKSTATRYVAAARLEGMVNDRRRNKSSVST